MRKHDAGTAISGDEAAGDPLAGSSPHEVLGVDRDTDTAGLRSAFRSLTRRVESDEARENARAAFEALARPQSRLTLDLLTPRESRLHDEIVRRYGGVRFELMPEDFEPMTTSASDLEWGEPFAGFEVPDVPKVLFENMLPAPPRGDELVVPERRK